MELKHFLIFLCSSEKDSVPLLHSVQDCIGSLKCKCGLSSVQTDALHAGSSYVIYRCPKSVIKGSIKHI